jgi:hypothetical protein
MTVTSNAEVQSLLLVEDALVVFSCIGLYLTNSHERRRCLKMCPSRKRERAS